MWGGAGGSGLVARRGLPRGCTSQAFTLDELAAALDNPSSGNVYVEPDAAGRVWSRAGAAAACVRARLAPQPAARLALLCLAPGHRPAPAHAPAHRPGPRLRLRLRVASAVPPLHELLLWPDAAALAALDMPFLTPLNIAGSKCYICHKCGAEFEDPNPLKVHLFLSCREYTTAAFWKRCLTKFEEMATNQSATEPSQAVDCPSQAATLWTGALHAWAGAGAGTGAAWPGWAPRAPSPASPAELEALAAAWGRSRDGHVCLYCGKLYSRKYGLKIHIRTHTGYKPLRCRHCLRAFGDPSNLNKHVRLHAQERAATGAGGAAPYACGVCGKALVRRRDLERHVRARHPGHSALAAPPALPAVPALPPAR